MKLIFIFSFHSDLSTNHLSTLHKDTFRGLTHLTSLDLSKNHLDFLPNDLLLDLDSLSNLWVVFSFTINVKTNVNRLKNNSFLIFYMWWYVKAFAREQVGKTWSSTVLKTEKLEDSWRQPESTVIVVTWTLSVDLSHQRWDLSCCHSSFHCLLSVSPH